MYAVLRTAAREIRPTDLVIASLLTALTGAMMHFQVGAETGIFPPGPEDPDGYRQDSNSVWLWFLVVAPVAVLWWRRNALVVTAFATAVYALHDVAFGYVVRCGSGLPLVFTLAFLIGLRHRGRELWLGLGVATALNCAVLAVDGAAGLEILPVTEMMSIGLMATGRVLQSRTQLSKSLADHNLELRTLRDQRAALEVSGDRARLSTELDTLLDQHLDALAAAADAAGASSDPAVQRRLLEGIEDDSRTTLVRMREIVGTLRGSEDAALSPAPSVERLDALLARHGGRQVTVTGDPRRLPTSVELSAYRIVEHLLSVLETEGRTPVDVAMTFTADALEIRVNGPVGKGAPVRDAVLRAKERARLQGGTLNVRVARGSARAVAQLPTLA